MRSEISEPSFNPNEKLGSSPKGSPIETEKVDDNEELSGQSTDVLIFDTPFHSDPQLTDQALDDSSMRKEIPRGALSVATFLTRKGFKANVAPMDAFLNQEFIAGQDQVEQIKKENFQPSAEPSTQKLQDEVANEAFFTTQMRATIKNLIEEKDPKIIAFSYMFSPTQRSVLAMARFVKENYPDKTIVIGGNAASFDEKTRQQLLDPENIGVDALVNYEGEWTMLDLAEQLENNGYDKSGIELSQVKGISFWDDGEIADNGRRERGDPSEIGPLNYDNVLLPEGVGIGDFNHYVLFARGCMGRCAFCTSREMYRGVVTSIGIESFRDELEYVAENVNSREEGEKNIGILDDDLLLELWFDSNGDITEKPSEAVEKKTVFEVIAPVLQEVKAKYPDINFIAQARVGHLRDENEVPVEGKLNPRANTLVENAEQQLQNMKDSGVNLILLGIESGSQEILDASLKDTRVEWVQPACEKIKKAGIDVGAFWIIGLPGATREREEESFRFLENLVNQGLIDELEAHVFVPLPGTSARTSETISKNMKYDDNLDETSRKALFNDQASYVHIDNLGNITLSKEEIQEIFSRTQKLMEQVNQK